MRVKFVRDYDYIPSGEVRSTLAYRADGGVNGDGEYTVKKEAGEAAVATGAAVELPPLSQSESVKS